MKLELLQENLRSALALVGRVAPSRVTLPVLANVLLKANGAGLQVSACDLTTSITVKIGCKTGDEGAITLPAKRLAEVVGLMPAERMSIDVAYSTQTATLKGSKAKTSIKGIEAAEFPVIPQMSNADALFKLPASDLLKAFRAVSFAMSTDASRPSLNATYIKLDGNCAKFAATDGFRLAEFSLPVTYSGDARSLLINADSVGHIERVLVELAKIAADVAVAVSKSNGGIIIGSDTIEIVSQLVDEKYVDYVRVIPRDSNTTVTVGVADFLLAAKQAAAVIADGHAIICDFEHDEDNRKHLFIHGKSDTGAADSSVEIEMTGPQATVKIDPNYLLQTISAISTVQCKISINDGKAPILIRPLGADDALYVVIPFNK